jgi:hypothetical protein
VKDYAIWRRATLEAAEFCDEQARLLAGTSDAKEKAPGAARCAHFLRCKVILADEMRGVKDGGLLAEYEAKRYQATTVEERPNRT